MQFLEEMSKLQKQVFIYLLYDQSFDSDLNLTFSLNHRNLS